MAAASQYLVHRDGQQYGPYTLAVLLQYYKQGQILRTDLVWTEGFERWITAVELVAGLPLGAETVAAAMPGAGAPAAPSHDSPTVAAGAEVRAPRTRRRVRPWVWVAGAAVVATLILVVLLAGPKPEDSLNQARAAYLQRNQANFDRYVDVASVLGDGVDQIVGVMMEQNHTGGFARLAIESAVPALKSIYLPAASRAVDRFIISGTLPQDSQSSGTDAAGALVASYVSAAMHKVAESQLSYQGVESMRISGGSATLNVRVVTPLSGEPVVLKVRMQKADGYWRIVAIEDLAGLLRDLGGLSAQLRPADGLAVAAPIAVPSDMPAPGAASPPSTDTAPVAAASSASPVDDPIGPGGFITPPSTPTAAGGPSP